MESRRKVIFDEKDTYQFFTIFVESIHQIKKNLNYLKNLKQFSRGKFIENEFSEHFFQELTRNIAETNSMLDSILDYINVINPRAKRTETVHTLIEELLNENQKELKEKGIKLIKKFGRNLPEVAISVEQLRYVLGSILRYAVTLVPAGGKIGLLTRLVDVQKSKDESRTFLEKNGKYVEIFVSFTGYKKPKETPLDRSNSKEEALGLELRLIDNVVKKNRGMMVCDVDEKEVATSIVLRFHLDRRNTIST